MSKVLKTTLSVPLVLVIVAVLLMLGVPPPPKDAHARLDRPVYYPKMGTILTGEGTDGDPTALDSPSRYWRLMLRLSTTAADSVEVKVRQVMLGEWTTLTFPGEAFTFPFTQVFNGPEIDSVEVLTGAGAICRLDYWYE